MRKSTSSSQLVEWRVSTVSAGRGGPSDSGSAASGVAKAASDRSVQPQPHRRQVQIGPNARARRRSRTGNVEVCGGRVGFQDRGTERQARQIAVDGGGGRAKGGRRHARDPVKQDRQLSTEGGTHAVVGSVSAWGARRRGAEYTHVVKGAKLVCATQRLWVEVHRDPQHAPRQDLHCKLGAVGCRGRPSGGDEALWRQARAGSVVRRRSPCKRMAYRSGALGAASVRRSSGGQCISAMMASSISRLPALTCAA